MAIHARQSLSGFVASNPKISFTERGDARLWMKVGQEHFQRNDDGSFTRLQTTFHELVLYRRAAERSYDLFRKGDRFVAEGYVREYTRNVDGQPQQAEEFVATKIGHDNTRTTYTVDRTPRAQRDEPARQQNIAAAAIEGQPADGTSSSPASAGGRAQALPPPPPPSTAQSARQSPAASL